MEGDIHSDSNKGIIPRAVEALFEGVSEADENIEFTFKVSYVEIYLEKIRDLLDVNRVKNNLTIREDKIKGVYIAGVTEEYVCSVEELLQIMHLGADNRATAATGMNEGSSRSHSVFTITVTQKDCMTNAQRSGKLVLVDLAGSEMVRKTNASGQQLEEAKMINKSLSALGQVINALTDEKATHIPYRDSKLTRILQDSLGGNSKTVLIVAVSPSSFNASETVSTLRFGTRAKSIENKAVINQTRSVEELEALLARAEKAIDTQSAFIMTLTAQLQAAQAQMGKLQPTEAVIEVVQNEPISPDEKRISKKQSFILDEGKTIIEISRLEQDAEALRKLQQTVLDLTQELDDERQFSAAKDTELKECAILLKEKERLIMDAANLVIEVKHSNDGLKERAEQLLKEKAEAVGEVQSIKASMEDEVSKLKYNIMEMEVSLNTLQTENQTLKKEIAELSGDAMDDGSAKVTKKNLISTNSTADEEANQNRRGSLVSSASSKRADTNEDSVATTTIDQRRELLEQYTQIFADVCVKYKMDNKQMSEIYQVLDAYAGDAEVNYGLLESKLETLEKQSSRRIKDLEDQRSKLEKDLQHKEEQFVRLQMAFDSMKNMDSQQIAATMIERDQVRQKSLQQRLEQLVAVHRQLLRKYASLELEAAELKKKTALRDDRIRQLENSARGTISNIRHQAEKHIAELETYRNQIQSMKQEHDFKLQKSAEASSNAVSSPVKINARLQPKSLRGGGGTGKSFYFKDEPSIGTATASSSSTTTTPAPKLKATESFFAKDDAFNDLLKDSSSSPLPSNFNAFSYGIASQEPAPPTTPRGTSSMFSRLLGQK